MGRVRQVRSLVACGPVFLLGGWVVTAAGQASQPPTNPPPIRYFIEAGSRDGDVAAAALSAIAPAWNDSYTSMLIDLARLMPGSRRTSYPTPDTTVSLPDDERAPLSAARGQDGTALAIAASPVRRRIIAFLEKQTRQRFGDDLSRWRAWMWKLPPSPHSDYAEFKGIVYSRIDPRLRDFFPPRVATTIRLDEIDWGGVPVNGIPPLRAPATVAAKAATYLKDSNLVFGITVNGQARAYPKRILAWHEMATDTLGGLDLTIVYCTLCGTVIPFESRAGGRVFTFGTSGLLYRSNKLMFDEQTRSLWSTFEGVPVVGPLVGSGLRLETHAVVTTTWKDWRAMHPDTSVLSIDTGYQRDYAEGAAYRDYFSTDRLMFGVSHVDTRLPNKAEVLVMRLTDVQPAHPVAIDVRLLRKQPVFGFAAAGRRFVVITTPGGANRVYETPAAFPPQPAGATIADAEGRRWRVTEDALVLGNDSATRLPRVSAQRAFWFGWYAQFPQTTLIK